MRLLLLIPSFRSNLTIQQKRSGLAQARLGQFFRGMSGHVLE
ncbi:MAG TPA: hypothetical protein VGP62_29795 [Bryobacteraceae bacterium]|jgi:hypothetical protein|nr:hypothetical protein [Bryobacteraceae bacterium]